MMDIMIAIEAPATTSLRKWTPPITRIVARIMPMIRMKMHTGIEYWPQANAIMKIEKVCLLGKLWPRVSVSRAGVEA